MRKELYENIILSECNTTFKRFFYKILAPKSMKNIDNDIDIQKGNILLRLKELFLVLFLHLFLSGLQEKNIMKVDLKLFIGNVFKYIL